MSPPLNSTARVSFHEKVKKRKRVFRFLRLELSKEIVKNLSEKSWGLKGFDERLVFLKNELECLIDDGEVSSCSPLNSTWKINQDMYDGAKTRVRTVEGDSEHFTVMRGLHQGSALRPFLFALVMDELIRQIQGEDGFLLNSQCTLYKSIVEELSIWGWPLQTAGLLTAGFSARSYAILSGRLTEWSNGEIGYLIRKASAVQMDPNTWILEYTLNPF
ncbi:hypothetical protein RND71_022694 [Anisodus tanguticus]|uniref:Reverse transcriptase domain-containing protein n=1 Tax=Anisodus tanguticus TaxID=243964 RepID=A0AAE1VD67_9SOLA|nr:hypothetical protein RND71_022694 [Anisodus tanguticus]